MSVHANPVGPQIERLRKTDCEGATISRPMFSVDQLRAFKPILSFLNAKDRDILYLVFVNGKKQKDIQEILDRSQPSLCYDIKRIRKRLKFIFYLDSVFDIFIEFISNTPADFDQFEADIMLLMFYTSSFTMVSEVLDVSQVKVRYSFDRCLRKLEELNMWEIYEIFMVVRNNLNLVRRTYRGGGDNEICREIFVPQ